MRIVNGPVRVNVTATDCVLIRRYRVENGARVYTSVLKIDADGNLKTIGEVQSNQSYL